MLSSCDDLQHMGLSGNYQLAGDIDCSQYAFTPIGTFAGPFVGSLDGRGFAISNLSFSSLFDAGSGALCGGLFCVLGNGSAVNNLRLVNETINASVTSETNVAVGELAGNGGYPSSITLTSVQGLIVISGAPYGVIGGLIGTNANLVDASEADISISVSTTETDQALAVGGLIGGDGGTSVSNSRALGSASLSGSFAPGLGGWGAIGGLVGYEGSQIANSYANVQVTASDYIQAGGLVGGMCCNTTSVQQSYATGNVSAGNGYNSWGAGGLIGWMDYGSTVSQSFATGAVSAGTDSLVGGLIGFSNPSGSSVKETYSVGKVQGGQGSFVGGLIGQLSDTGIVANSYWDTQTSGTTISEGGKGLTTKQLKCLPNNQTYCDSDGLPNNFGPAVWEPVNTQAISPANGAFYPQLWALSFPIPVSAFPLAGFTPYTASVATVFDHSPETGPASGIAALYSDKPTGDKACKAGVTCCDGVVEAFDGQEGQSSSGHQNEPTCEEAGYGQAGFAKFVFNDVNYIGCGTVHNQCGGPYYLNYEGHPGFDYPAKVGTTVFAPVSGTVYYPLKAIGTGGQNATYCVWHTMGEIPDTAAAYRVYYLHLLTHPAVANQGACSGVPGTSGTTVSFTPASGCNYTINGKPITAYQFPLPQGTHVQAGCAMAESGDAGLSGASAAHLHFEIQEIVPLAYWSQPPPGIQYFPCWDEKTYKGKNANLYCLPMDPYGWTGGASNCPTNPSQWQGDIWYCLTGIANVQNGISARRFWAQ